MQAIILAAGVGRRLTSLDQKTPKSLLTFEGKSLMTRHFEQLEACGIRQVLIVVGHLDEMIRQEAAKYPGQLEIDFAFNERYRRGSIISLATGLEAMRPEHDALVMDADVLYHPDVLRRLVEAPFGNGFLLDPRASSDGEEMMLGVKDGRVQTISRAIGDGWDLMGEGVGFFKICAEDVPQLGDEIRKLLEQGHLDTDYEDGIDQLLQTRAAYHVSVEDLPWTEIDFDEDVENARNVILPAIAKSLTTEARASL